MPGAARAGPRRPRGLRAACRPPPRPRHRSIRASRRSQPEAIARRAVVRRPSTGTGDRFEIGAPNNLVSNRPHRSAQHYISFTKGNQSAEGGHDRADSRAEDGAGGSGRWRRQAPRRSRPSPPAGPAGTIIGAAVGSVVATLGRLVALRERDVVLG